MVVNMMVVDDSRKMIRIFITPAAKATVEGYASIEGMSEMAVASRVYEAFGVLPEVLQDYLTQKIPDDAAVRAATIEAIIRFFEAEKQRVKGLIGKQSDAVFKFLEDQSKAGGLSEDTQKEKPSQPPR